MRVKRGWKLLFLIVAVGGIGALLTWAFMERRKELAMEQERERPVEAPSRVSIQEGESIVTLDEATQLKSGIAVAPLELTSHREETRAYGTVVELQGLVDLRNRYAAAKAQVKKAQASLEASRKEYERLKTLHADDRSISDKALQAAEATWRSDEAEASSAQEALHALERSGRQQWGGVLARWLFDASPDFDRLAQLQDVLVQITVPPGVAIASASQTASIQAADGRLVSAQLVSPSPHTDPRIQGLSFFYLAPAQGTSLLPGMNILAYLPVGSEVQGVVLPAKALVWWQGKAWVYVQKDPEHFVRREVSTETPAQEGWFVTKGLSATDRLVVSGAQLLLSEEFRAQIQVGEEEAK